MFKKNLFLLSVVFSSIFLNGCFSKKTEIQGPAKVLEQYVNLSLTVKSDEDRKKLSDLTTGEAKKNLQEMSGEDFKAAFIDTKREFLALKVKDERTLTEDQYSITYELSYKNKSANSDDLITLKKHAVLNKSGPNGEWLISDVKNIKTDIEHQTAISF